MAGFVVSGTDQNARARLQAQMDADKSAFEAQLSALFGATAKPKPQASTQTKATAAGWGTVTSRRESRSGTTRFNKR